METYLRMADLPYQVLVCKYVLSSWQQYCWQGKVVGDGEGKYLLSQLGKGSLLVPEEGVWKQQCPKFLVDAQEP